MATKVKMSGGEKQKANRKTYNISSIKRFTRNFHVIEVQNNGKETGNRVCCICKNILFFCLDLFLFE